MRFMMQKVSNQTEDDMIMQKRLEQKKINKLRTDVANVLETVQESDLNEILCILSDPPFSCL